MQILIELFGLEVLEEPSRGAFEPVMVVRGIPGDRDERVLVGLLEGHFGPLFAATRRIPGVPMTGFWHGPWTYQIDI